MPAYKDRKINSWYVKFRIKNWKDEVKWITKRGFATKREALRWEHDYQLRQAGDITMQFKDFTILYEKDIRPRLKESTWETKIAIIETKILPYFGEKKLSDIKTTDIVQWQNDLLTYRDDDGNTYSASYLKTVHNQLSAILNHAVRYYNLQGNPARIVGNMGSEKGIVMQFWTMEEYKQFSEAMMDMPLAYYCFEMLYWCGIREGELLALTPADFDFAAKTLTITKTYHRSKGRDIVTEPKTPKSRRTISMPDFLCDEMQEYFKMLYDSSPTDRAFQISKGFLQYRMKKGIELAGLKRIRVHDLRHSHVSLLIHMGFSAVAISERMGHESIDITYRYAHLFPSVQKSMAFQLDKLKKEV